MWAIDEMTLCVYCHLHLGLDQFWEFKFCSIYHGYMISTIYTMYETNTSWQRDTNLRVLYSLVCPV